MIVRDLFLNWEQKRMSHKWFLDWTEYDNINIELIWDVCLCVCVTV